MQTKQDKHLKSSGEFMPKTGKQSLRFETCPAICAYAAIAGKKERAGPLGTYFDHTDPDTYFGQKTWEKAENQMQQLALQATLKKGALPPEAVDVVFSGDLLNQCIGSSFSLRGTGIPVLGLYGACSTMAEALLLAAAAIDGGYAAHAAALTSSHFAAAERQYRNPLGYGAQRTPTAQWTVTGAGCMLLGRAGSGPYLEAATVGRICDLGIQDANQMGAAMAPAAYDTLTAHFCDLHRKAEDYDFIVTGDLGKIGRQIVLDFFRHDGITLTNYDDCGCMIYDLETQDVHAGGSGCGCSASVLCGYLMRLFQQKKLRRLLFCGTGALLSPTSTNQGESIPGVCHAVSICAERTAAWNI